MQRRITAGEAAAPVRVVIVTLDNHLAEAAERARPVLERAIPGLSLSLHAAAEWAHNPGALDRCREDISNGDIILATMLFMDDHIQAVLPWLKARRDTCDAMIGCLSAGEIIKLTRLGQFAMDGTQGGAMALLKRLRGSTSKKEASSGAGQMAMLRRLPKLLRFIPGKAQDVRAYFLTLQYWLAGSEDNVTNMVRFLVDRYSSGSREKLRGTLKAALPVEYPDAGVYHPRMSPRIAEHAAVLPRAEGNPNGTVGVLLMRSYLLANNTAHYDGVISALEAQGLNVVPVFASGLDARPAIDTFFKVNGQPAVDAVVSLTGFSLVGGPAYNDAKAAEEILVSLDVPYISAHALEFQTLEQWSKSDRGLMPIEATMMVAIPELDGATGPAVYGGRSDGAENGRTMQSLPERAHMLAARVANLVKLRRAARANRKVAVVIFNFPPNAGAVGTAAFLSVFESLHNTLLGLKAAGYSVDVPESVDALRDNILKGNAAKFGANANVHTRIPADVHVRKQRWLSEIEAQWGPAPGRQNSDGSTIHILGAEFGNVLVAVQPAFGFEGDPMRLLFEKGFAPTHAFAAFYRYIADDWGANAVLHFGTHGALEFMPGKQAGLSADCWPDRLIGALPNFYLYAANNPSEGTLAKRRSAATLISYLTPPIAQAGLYRGLIDLKSSLQRWRELAPEDAGEHAALAAIIQAQAAALDLADAEPQWHPSVREDRVQALLKQVLDLEYALIPHGMHVVGQAASESERAELLQVSAEATHGVKLNPAITAALAAGSTPADALAAAGLPRQDTLLPVVAALADTNRLLAEDHELPALIHALDGKFVRPAPSGDLIRAPQILPTGRNLHGFDPFRIPSAFAIADGARQAERLLNRHREDGNALPETIALVLWGTDNLKSEGAPIAQALALIGAKPRFDSYGRLCGANLIPLKDLGRPRIDVVVTLSGIFRDLLPLQTKLLAEAALLAAQADEPLEQNFVRRNALNYMKSTGATLETAALRVFSNADGAYGSNVNQMIESGAWVDEDELAETYTRRKSFAYGCDGRPVQQAKLLNSMLTGVNLTYQNLESVELGITTVDHYFDTLGGISRAVRRASGSTVPVYIGDQTRGEGQVRTLSEQVALETRTRMLNPKWYEGMLKHGYEGVRNIEAHVTNTLGWSATTGAVQPWVYQQITQTFVLDPEMRERLAALNPTASAKVANRLLEAHERKYWTPDENVLDALKQAGADLEDRLEGIGVEVAA